MTNPNNGNGGDNVKGRILATWLLTIEGFAAIGVLIWWALWAGNFSYQFQIGFWLVYPLISVLAWWFSAKISIWQTKSLPADAGNPQHLRVIKILDGLFPKTGLRHRPPLFVSPNPVPNAFATGPYPGRAVIAVTEGLLSAELNLSDAEIEGVLAHELSHVANYDVAINSLIAVMSSIFFQIFDVVVQGWIAAIKWIKKPVGFAETRLLPPFVGQLLSYAIFWVAQQLVRLIQLFVVRSRESGADALGASFTGAPCALASGLQKLAAYSQDHRPTGREAAFLQVWRVVMTIDPLNDSTSVAETAPTTTFWQKLVKVSKDLQLTHPPVPSRVAELERMNGGPCSVQVR